MARKATLEGTQRRLENIQTALYNVERELFFAGVTDVSFVRFSPGELSVESDDTVAEVTVEEENFVRTALP